MLLICLQNGLNMDGSYDFKKCIGLKVKPRMGDGFLFYSTYPNNTIDQVGNIFPLFWPFPFLQICHHFSTVLFYFMVWWIFFYFFAVITSWELSGNKRDKMGGYQMDQGSTRFSLGLHFFLFFYFCIQPYNISEIVLSFWFFLYMKDMTEYECFLILVSIKRICKLQIKWHNKPDILIP